MKFRFGPIIASEDRCPEPGWRTLPEIRPRLFGLLSILVAAVLVLLVGGFWRARMGPSRLDLVSFGLSLVVAVAVHELLHACLLPGFPRSDRIHMGLWPSRGFFVYYEGPLTRERWLLVAMAPLLGLTVIPMLLAAGLGLESRFWAEVSTWNAAGACADVVCLRLVLAGVPRGATLENRGLTTYWKD
jgi:hypothetical protein